MRRNVIWTLLLLAGLGVPAAAQGTAGAGALPGEQRERHLPSPGGAFSCTARNATATRQCSTTCPTRESADCEDAEGAEEPICRCTTGPDDGG